jgi:hypothetical protein
MRSLASFGAIVGVAALAVHAGVADAGVWLVRTRTLGCVDIKHLAEMEKLSRVPTTPKEYADIMRARGHKVTIGLPKWAPPEMKDKAVVVTVNSENRLFVQEELCNQPAPDAKR